MCIRGVLKMGHLRVCGVAMGIYGLISWETMGGQGAAVWFGQDLAVDFAEIWPVFGNQCAIRQRNMYLHWNKGGIFPVDNSWVEENLGFCGNFYTSFDFSISSGRFLADHYLCHKFGDFQLLLKHHCFCNSIYCVSI